MCGIWGYVGRAADRDELGRVAAAASRRGPEGWGAAWRDSAGRTAVHRAAGRLDLAELRREIPAGPLVVVGHCRLATSGGAGLGVAADTGMLQPLVVGRWSVAHNGNVYNHAELFASNHLTNRSGVDSEAIPALAEYFAGSSAAQSLHRALSLVQPSALAVIAYHDSGRVFAARRTLPLFWKKAPSGVYLSSVNDGSFAALPDCALCEVVGSAVTVRRSLQGMPAPTRSGWRPAGQATGLSPTSAASPRAPTR